MKKKLLFLFIGLLSTSILFAQNLKFKFGPEQKYEKRSSLSMIGADGENLFMLQTKSKASLFSSKSDLFLQKYDDDFKLKKISELKMPKNNGNDMEYEGMKIIDHEIKIFTSFYNKKLDKNFSFVNSINDKGLVEADYKELDQIAAEKAKNSGDFIFRYSADTSKVLLISQMPFKKGTKETFSCKVFDNKFNLIFERTIELPFKDEKFSFYGYTVSNEGQVYVLGLNEIKNKSRKKPGAIYTILALNKNEEGYKQFDLDIDKFLSDVFIKVNTQNDLICAGFYADEKGKGTKGTIALKINGSTLEIVNKNIAPFSKEVMTSIVGDSKRKQKKGLYAFDIRDLILKDDGGIIMVAEQFFIHVVTTRSSNGVTTTTYYYYNNDILVVNLRSDVTTEWISHIPKKQLTKNDGGAFNSYALHVSKDKMYILFNDNKKNEKNVSLKKLKPMSNPIASNLTLVTLDGKGKSTRKVLFNSKKEKIVVRPKTFVRLNNNTDAFFGKAVTSGLSFFGPSKYKLGKVTFE